MQPLIIHKTGSKLPSVKLCSKINANGVIFAPFSGAGKQKVDNKYGSLERYPIELAASAIASACLRQEGYSQLSFASATTTDHSENALGTATEAKSAANAGTGCCCTTLTTT